MTYNQANIPIAGPSYQSRSKPLSSQQTVNWYPQYNDEGKEAYTLMPFPGLKPEGGFNTPLVDRGLTRMKEVLFQVKGDSLYQIDQFATHEDKGEIPGVDRCVFANDGTNLMIVTDGLVYMYSSDTDAITNKSSEFTGPVLSVDVINNVFIFTLKEASAMFEVDNTTKDLIFAGEVGAVTKPDDLVRDFVFEQTVWRCGLRTMEAWYYTDSTLPPISQITGQIFDTGLAAVNSIAQTDESFYWLGSDYSIYRARGGSKERISHDGISNKLSKLDVENAIGFCFTLEGQNFYCLKIPNNFTYVMNETLGKKGWFELSSGIEGDDWQASSVIDCYGKLWTSDESNGKIYTLDLDTYTNDGKTLKRTRVTPSINASLFGLNGRRVQMSRAEFIMESGIGLISGQGEDPKIIIEASYDGGKTFNHEGWVQVGRLGNSTLRVEWFNLANFTDMMIRMTTTDPVPYYIYSGTIELKLGGK